MAYRNKTYICFDADTDMKYYRLMQAWNENGNVSFDFHNAHELNRIMPWSGEEAIKRALRERMLNSKVAIVLIGAHTKDLHKFVRWEIEQAQRMGIPLIGVNLNKMKQVDNNLCPAILRDNLAVHIAYGQKIIDHALNNWPQHHYKLSQEGKSGGYSYPMLAYKQRYPDFQDEIYTVDDWADFSAAS